MLVFTDWNYRRYFFSCLQLKQINDCRSSCRSSCFRYLIYFQAIYFSQVRKEHQIMVSRCHQQLINIIILKCLHAFNSFSTSVLIAEIIYCHSFDVSQLRHGNDSIFIWNHIFHGNIIIIKTDGCSSFIAIFFSNGQNFFTNDTQEHISVCQYCLQLPDFFHQFLIFCFQLFSFQTGKCLQTHIYNRLSLYICQSKYFY